jgi:hypothetical protein
MGTKRGHGTHGTPNHPFPIYISGVPAGEHYPILRGHSAIRPFPKMGNLYQACVGVGAAPAVAYGSTPAWGLGVVPRQACFNNPFKLLIYNTLQHLSQVEPRASTA